MIFRIGILGVILCCFTQILAGQNLLEVVRFEGNKKTKTAFLNRFIQSQQGEISDSLIIDTDIQALKNLSLFYNVRAVRSASATGDTLTFVVNEVFTLLPNINFGGIRENFWFQLGAAENNLLGRGISLNASYRYYDRHSFFSFLQVPFIKGSKWGASLGFQHLATEEPIDFPDIGVNTTYNYDNTNLELLGRYTFSMGNFVELGGAYLNEHYKAKFPDQLTPDKPTDFSIGKWLGKSAHTLDRINYHYYLLDGVFNRISFETVYTPAYKDLFWKFQNSTNYYKRVGKKGNFASRLRLGIANNRFTEFPPFVLDSYLNIRGSGNRVNRGSGEMVLNLEYRQTAYEKKFGAIQVVGFVDIGGWRLSGRGFSTFWDTRVAYSGAGVRLYIRKFYNFILRFDYAFNIVDVKQNGLVIGVGQYF